MRTFRTLLLGAAASLAIAAAIQPASALSLREAIQIAFDSNPEIGQAIENRSAIDFELEQAVGLYLPRIDLEASAGAELLSNPSRRAAGVAQNALIPMQVGVSVSYDLWDSGFRNSEIDRQAARVDGAAFRVLERSEFIALGIAQQYFEVLLQARVMQIAQENVAFHQATLSDVNDAIASGALTEADRQQALERLSSATARLLEAQEALAAARISFLALVGVEFQNGQMPARVGAALPQTLDLAIGLARVNNPRILLAAADVDAAAAVVEQSKSALGPKLSFQGGAYTGDDLGGTDGITTDLQAKLVLRWTIFDGGIRNAEVQENQHRETEAMYAQQQAFREVEESVRVSWNRITSQGRLAAQYSNQLAASSDLVSTYREQFTVGERTLLDVLDAQNSRFGVQILVETARFAVLFSEYRLLAATGTLVEFMGVTPPGQAVDSVRASWDVTPAEDYQPRTLEPVNLNAPIDLTKFTN